MLKKIMVTLTMVAVIILGIAVPGASAHHNTITGKATCNTSTGNWDAVWTVQNSETISETITASSRPNVVPVGTVIAGSATKAPEFKETFTSKPVNQSLNLAARWTNGQTANNGGALVVVGDTCSKPDVLDAAASVSTTPATCDVGESLVYGNISHAVFSGTANGTKGPAAYNVTATADAGHRFANNSKTKVFTGTLAGPDAGKCAPPPPPPCKVCELPAKASQGDAVCNGNNLSGTYDTIRVAAGSTCSLTDVYVNEDVIAKKARNLFLFNATVRGDVRASRVSGDVYFGSAETCKWDPKVGGSVIVNRSHNVLLCNTEVCEDVVIRNNDGKITVSDTTARKVAVLGNKRFVADKGDTSHLRLSNIRLIHVIADSFSIKDNAPRKVVRR